MVLFWEREEVEEVVIEGEEEKTENEDDALLVALPRLGSRQYLSTAIVMGDLELALLLRRLVSHLLNSHLTDAAAHRLQPLLSPLHFICKRESC